MLLIEVIHEAEYWDDEEATAKPEKPAEKTDNNSQGDVEEKLLQAQEAKSSRILLKSSCSGTFSASS